MPDTKLLRTLATDVQVAIENHARGRPNAQLNLTTSIEKLQKAAAEPATTVLKKRYHTVQNISIIMADEMGLLAALTHSTKPMTALELSKVTEYNVELIVRVMRMISALGYCDEVGSQRYQANEVTRIQETAGAKGALVTTNEWVFPIGAQIRTWLRSGTSAKQTSSPRTQPPYDFALGESCWETLRRKPEWKKAFDDNMTARNEIHTIPWFDKYPAMETLDDKQIYTEDTVRIVDIGGNKGFDLNRFASRHPEYTGELILQDLAETLHTIAPNTLDKRITIQVHDFFTEQPVKDADIYYLKSVLHDWDDAQCTSILSNTAKAMTAQSRLLIHELVIGDTEQDLQGASLDMLMLLLSNGKERTMSQWRELLRTSEPQLELLKVWKVDGDEQCVVEAKLAQD
ncbi:MAG: hypothetical protein M1828_004178 [Chrysothrix sp. TS-e1954]|nr:MAG: hypothetical protein M1828_004178 [Chrysothrix sp. TS-e1954]